MDSQVLAGTNKKNVKFLKVKLNEEKFTGGEIPKYPPHKPTTPPQQTMGDSSPARINSCFIFTCYTQYYMFFWC